MTNRALAAATVRLDFLFAADFADIAEVSSGKRKQKAEVRRSFDPSGPGEAALVFAYQHEKLNHATRIRISAPGTITDDGAAVSATLSLAPQEAQRISIDVAPVFLGEPSHPWFGLDGEKMAAKDVLARHEAWLSGCIEFEPSNQTVKSAWARAATDLWSLQALEGEGDAAFTPIGGIPKYTGLFGRDSLVVGVQSTFLNRATLNGSLLSVGEWTAKEVDNGHDAEPGKVLHQRQLSPLALLGTTPFLHYYGDYSAPAYYLIGAALHFAESGDARGLRSRPRQGRGDAGLDGSLRRHRRRRVLRIPYPRRKEGPEEPGLEGFRSRRSSIPTAPSSATRLRSPRSRDFSTPPNRRSPPFSPRWAKPSGRRRSSTRRRR